MENYQLSAALYDRLPTLIGDGSLKPLQTTNLGDLSPISVRRAMDMNRAGQVSARKLCFQVGKALAKMI
jgi:hypothetical protein